MKYRSLAALAIVGVIGLSACGDDSSSGTPGAGDTTMAPAATNPAGADFNDADVVFAQSMIPHHEQAIEMADIALDPNVVASDQVKALATRIKGGQDPEIAMMTGWLTAWGQPMSMDAAGHDMGSMDGMMSSTEMDEMGAMTGTDFDKMWMELMIRHHEGAIAMAQTVKTDGQNPDVLALADQVITAQQGEIDEMKAILGA
jgi:uncharacterized protein (DUF305 family)